MTTEPQTTALAALLEWYQAMGADAAVGEAPVDWLARGDVAPALGFTLPQQAEAPSQPIPAKPGLASPAPAAPEPRAADHAPAPVARAPLPQRAPPAPPASQPPRPASPSPPLRQFTAAPPDAAELSARAAARNAATLADLETALQSFDGCGLKATAKNLCFYRGAGKARLMIIGEAPGRDEDIEGKPFVGRAGQLLDKMLSSIGLGEADVHITNIVYWRPPGNRTPTPQEAQVCRPFLERQLELVAPEIVVLLGGAAAKHVLDVADGIMKIRGKWREAAIGASPVKTIATLHPAYLLRTPAAKRLVWRDLIAIKAALAS